MIKVWGKFEMKKQAVILVALMGVAIPMAQAATPPKLNAFAEGERLVYTQLVESYRHNRLAEVKSERTLLEKNYPESIHLDNAYYMTGLLEFQNMRYGEALKNFDVVRNRFAKSNKRPAALLATAATYQKLNLSPLAVRVYEGIMKEYPGSPESQRAWMQLQVEKKMLKSKAKAKG